MRTSYDSEWVTEGGREEFISFFQTSRSLYMPCNHDLYIGIIIFPHIDKQGPGTSRYSVGNQSIYHELWRKIILILLLPVFHSQSVTLNIHKILEL